MKENTKTFLKDTIVDYYGSQNQLKKELPPVIEIVKETVVVEEEQTKIRMETHRTFLWLFLLLFGAVISSALWLYVDQHYGLFAAVAFVIISMVAFTNHKVSKEYEEKVIVPVDREIEKEIITQEAREIIWTEEEKVIQKIGKGTLRFMLKKINGKTIVIPLDKQHDKAQLILPVTKNISELQVKETALYDQFKNLSCVLAQLENFALKLRPSKKNVKF
jgi:uncharacterized membrane protein